MDKLQNKQIIYIIDDEPESLSLLKDIIESKIQDVIVYTFTDYSFLNNDLNSVDLFILDTFNSQCDNSFEACKFLYGVCPNTPLLMLSNYTSANEIIKNLPSEYVVDFVTKPLMMDVFVNRLNVLLRISKNTCFLKEESKEFQKNIWSLLQHVVGMYIVVSKLDGTILLCNDYFVKDLGYNSCNDIISKKWQDSFITDEELQIINSSITDPTKLFSEAATYLKTNMDSQYFVKWFFALVNDKNNLVLGIGAPIIRDNNSLNNVDSIRDYFKNLLTRDKNVIDILKKSINNNG